MCAEGVCWQIQHRGRLPEVRSSQLRPCRYSGTAANHLYRLCVLADDNGHLYAQEVVVRRKAETENSSQHQLRTSCSKQQRGVESVTLATETAAITTTLPSVAILLNYM